MLDFFLPILFRSINGINWLFIVNGSWDPANYKGKSAVFVTKMKTAMPIRITNILVTKRAGVVPKSTSKIQG